MLYFDQENCLRYLRNENIGFQTNLHIHAEKLIFWLNTNIHQGTEQRKLDSIRLEEIGETNQDLLKMERLSMHVLCRLIAITNKYQSIDEWMQKRHKKNTNFNKNEIIKISDELNQITNLMNACEENLEAIKLINNKCLQQSLQLPIECNDKTSIVHLSNNLTKTDDNQKYNVEEESQEYFGLNFCEEPEINKTEREYSVCDFQEELQSVNKKVTRSCFAPVLKQLKSKIEPIKTEMKERELKYLISKGLDREKIIAFDGNEDIQALQSKPDQTEFRAISSKGQYDDTRSFLQQKQQMIIIPIDSLPSQSSPEDILE